MKVVVDVFGGDNSPSAVLNGAVAALNEKSDLELVLSGKKGVIESFLSSANCDLSRIEILDADTVITNDDSPTEAIRSKKDSSIVRAIDYLNNHDDAQAFVSAGSTGAVLTACVILLRRIRGINRPALAPLLPTVAGGKVLLIDCGANAEPKPLNLYQFAQMGSAYMERVLGISSPRIAVLSNGTEDKKGTTLTREAFQLIKEDTKLNFLGNMEARDLLSGKYDVVVSDGFAGNAALKSAEGTALALFSLIKQNILEGGLRAKLGYLLLKPALKKVKKTMDYNDQGGAVLLGLKKIVVKAHGSSKAEAISAAILQAADLAESGIIQRIEDSLIHE